MIALPVWVYVVKCGDGSFYTGITGNFERRFKEHQEDKGCQFLKRAGKRPFQFFLIKQFCDRKKAMHYEQWFQKRAKQEKNNMLWKKGEVIDVMEAVL